MAQVSDYVLDNQGFASFRTELNNILSAINSSNIGSSAPASAVAGTIWVDNGTSNTIKIKVNDGSDNLDLASTTAAQKFQYLICDGTDTGIGSDD